MEQGQRGPVWRKLSDLSQTQGGERWPVPGVTENKHPPHSPPSLFLPLVFKIGQSQLEAKWQGSPLMAFFFNF